MISLIDHLDKASEGGTDDERHGAVSEFAGDCVPLERRFGHEGCVETTGGCHGGASSEDFVCLPGMWPRVSGL